ncbi:hypothetical protein FXO38_34590 [Capsicum annuum]|nr:hypothetical protein FXO38_34590 [Capsicum annuum]
MPHAQLLENQVSGPLETTEAMTLIDLGCDFYITKFNNSENMVKALHSEPWLPQLPTEFYDQEILERIGSKLGVLLKIDICTSSTFRGRYARICIQVPLDVPLKTQVSIGSHKQRVVYKGLNCSAYPYESKVKKVLQNGKRFHFKVMKNKSITASRLVSLIKGLDICGLSLSEKIVHPYLTPTVHEMEQRYIKTFKPYTDEVKDMSIDALKVKLKGMTILTSLREVADEDEDLGCNNYVPSPARVFDHAGSSEFKTTPDASNDDDLRERVAMLEKSVLDISSFVRDETLRRIKKIKKKNQDDDEKAEEEMKKEEEEEEDDDDEEEEEEERKAEKKAEMRRK